MFGTATCERLLYPKTPAFRQAVEENSLNVQCGRKMGIATLEETWTHSSSHYRLLEAQKAENGNAWPETVAVVLWGTDNIKTYGESLAQVMMMVGINPVADPLGRVNKLEVQ